MSLLQPQTPSEPVPAPGQQRYQQRARLVAGLVARIRHRQHRDVERDELALFAHAAAVST